MNNPSGTLKKMELQYCFWMSGATLLACCYLFLYKFVRSLNGWYYDMKLGEKKHLLPPGHMGWPLIGNMFSFFKDFNSDHPESFLHNIVSKYGRSGIYKTHLFMHPSVIVCTTDTCKRVLNDDDYFKTGYPKSFVELFRSKLVDVSTVELQRFRCLVTAPIMGHTALSIYLERIDEIVTNSLEEIARKSLTHLVEIHKEMKGVSMKVIIHMFIGSYNHDKIKQIEDLFGEIEDAIFSWPINLPGFPYYKAHKNREKLEKVLESLVEERKMMIKNGQGLDKKYFVDILLEVKLDESGQNMDSQDIVDLLIVFLFAGQESTATTLMWSMIYLMHNPSVFKKAKEEQEEIMKSRPPSQKQLSLTEIKQMVYLNKVINEVLRLANITFATYREATADANINGYIIPKGWKVLVWLRAIHVDPEYHPNPKEFNPSRWDDNNAKAGTFLPFGAGTRLCPGRDLAKLETSIFLHHFILNYRLEQKNPECCVRYLPAALPKDKCLAKLIKVSSDA